MEPLPTPDESYWIDDKYYGYLGDKYRFGGRVFAEGTTLDQAIERLRADPWIKGLEQLGPGDVRISVNVVGYRPMVAADHTERDWARKKSAEREANREERERERLRRTLEHFGIPTETYIFDTPPDQA